MPSTAVNVQERTTVECMPPRAISPFVLNDEESSSPVEHAKWGRCHCSVAPLHTLKVEHSSRLVMQAECRFQQPFVVTQLCVKMASRDSTVHGRCNILYFVIKITKYSSYKYERMMMDFLVLRVAAGITIALN